MQYITALKGEEYFIATDILWKKILEQRGLLSLCVSDLQRMCTGRETLSLGDN